MDTAKKDKIILIVEDNVMNRELVCDLLEAYGYTVRYAEDAGGFWEELNRCPSPDLILMDLQLPETDGYTLVAEVKQKPHLTHCPIIALTAFAMQGDKEKAMNAGCQGMITKPIDTRLFPAQIEQFLKTSDQ